MWITDILFLKLYNETNLNRIHFGGRNFLYKLTGQNTGWRMMSYKQSHPRPKEASIRKAGDYSFPFYFCPRQGQKDTETKKLFHSNFENTGVWCEHVIYGPWLIFVLCNINARENTIEVNKIIHIYTHTRTYLYKHNSREFLLLIPCFITP